KYSSHARLARSRVGYPGPRLWLRPMYKAQGGLELASRRPVLSAGHRPLVGARDRAHPLSRSQVSLGRITSLTAQIGGPLSGANLKTFTRSELYGFDPQRTSPLLSGCKMPVERN